MLLVHPSSQCDVCLDPYTWSTPAKAPHAIQCGHVFCLDCLRSVHPTNCPLCRKGFNPERIKKLHVDKVNGDGSGPAGPILEEYELYRRIAALFDHHTDPGDINTLVEEVNAWVARSTRPSDMFDSEQNHPLRTAVTALHQLRALQIEKEEIKKQLSKLRDVHERHVTLKDKDIRTAMLVERRMLQESQKTEEDINALRSENARLQEELRRYTHSSNPLPRPPEINPRITNLTRQLATLPPGQYSNVTTYPPVPQGFVPNGAVVPAGDPQLQQTADAPPTGTTQTIPSAPAPGARSKYRITSTGEELRQENRRRSHLIVPGAGPEVKVLPLHMDMDATPRATATVPIAPMPDALSMWAGEDWPEDYTDPRSRPGEPVMWAGGVHSRRARVPNQVMSIEEVVGHVTVPHPAQPPAPRNKRHPPSPPVGMPSADVPYLTRSARVRIEVPDDPVVGREPLEWRPGPAHRKGFVQVYDPPKGICWMHEKRAAKLPVRARGTQSDYPYAIAKEPSELDEKWGSGASPGPNPLGLTGVPDSTVAGPSNSTAQREEEDALFSTAREGSALFQSQRIASGHAAPSKWAAHGPGPSAAAETSLSGLLGFAGDSSQGGLFGLGAQPEPGQSTTARPAIQTQVPAEGLPQPSPASSWGGTYQASRRSSLSLQLNNLPTPHGSQGASDSVEQVSISEFFGQSMTVDIVPDNTSFSFRSGESHDVRRPGLLMGTSSREDNSRQVVTGLQDLEDINRSLREVAESAQSDGRSTRPPTSASSHQSRQAAATVHDAGAHVGLRTGFALYSSRPPTQHAATGPSNEPSPAPPPAPSTHVRSLSRASERSRAESTVNHNTNGGVSSQRSSGQRHRRSSTASSVHFHDQVETHPAFWPAEPHDTRAYTSQGPYEEAALRGSQESIPRSLGSIGEFGAGGGLLLSFEAPSTSAAVDRHGEQAAGIHAPRPVSSRQSTRSLFSGAWNARNGR